MFYLDAAQILAGIDLDIIGKWCGIARNDSEPDDSYRGRIKDEILGMTAPAISTPAPYAKAGEAVTCELGHPIARAARDIVKGEAAFSPGQFEWLIQEPLPLDVPPTCSCGAPFFRAGRYHFEGGWR